MSENGQCARCLIQNGERVGRMKGGGNNAGCEKNYFAYKSGGMSAHERRFPRVDQDAREMRS